LAGNQGGRGAREKKTSREPKPGHSEGGEGSPVRMGTHFLRSPPTQTNLKTSQNRGKNTVKYMRFYRKYRGKRKSNGNKLKLFYRSLPVVKILGEKKRVAKVLALGAQKSLHLCSG